MVRSFGMAAQRPRDPATAHRRACASRRPPCAVRNRRGLCRRRWRRRHRSFQTESEGYLTDPALLDRLAGEKLEREAAAVRGEGWKWVEIAPDADYDRLRSFWEVKGKPQPLPAQQAKALAKAEREADRLREIDDLTDEQADRLDALDTDIATLSEPDYLWSDRQKDSNQPLVINPAQATSVAASICACVA